MFAGGENKIPEGGKKAVDALACDPSAQSCVDWAPAEEISYSTPEFPKSADAPECVPDPDEFAVSDMSLPPELPVMTQAQAAFYKDAPDVSEYVVGAAPPYDYEIKSDQILDGIFVDLKKPKTPASAIESLVMGPPVGVFSASPGITATSISESHDYFGAPVDGRQYARAYTDGLDGLRDVGIYLELSPEEMISADSKAAEDGLASYAYAEKSIYAEGISYGWTVPHALEFYKTSVYDAGRTSVSDGGSGHEAVEVTGFNFGLNMTDLNKRDPSGKLGDILRDRMRQLANDEFGKQEYEHGYAGNGVRSADNIAATKNMTVLVMGGPDTDLTPEKAEAGLAKIQKGLEEYVKSYEFEQKIAEAHGDCAEKIDMTGVRIGLAGYYGKSKIQNGAAAKGTLETRIVEFLGELHYGEDVASNRHKSIEADEPVYVHTKSVAGKKGAKAATHALYGLYKSSSPGVDKVWEVGVPNEGGLEVTEEDMLGEVLRDAHDFGIGLRHAYEIKARFKILQEAIAEYKSVRRDNPRELDAALAKVAEARADLKGYLESPPESIDPARLGVVERLNGDYERSRKVYRFRAANGEDLMVYKPDYIQEVLNSEIVGAKGFAVEMAVMGGDEFTVVVKDAKGKLHVIYMEVGNCRDGMKRYAPQDGVRDPVFAQLFDIVIQGFENLGRDGDVSIGEASRIVISSFNDVHKARPYTYTQKSPVPGGKWNGIQFGIKGNQVYLSKPEDMTKKEFEAKKAEILVDKSFKSTIEESFPSVESADKVEVVSAAEFAKLGATSRHPVWHLENSGNEIYLESATPPVEGAYKPERTLSLQAAVAPLKDIRDFNLLVTKVLPKGAQKLKGTGESVVELPGLTWEQRRKARVEERLSYSAGTFMVASIGSKMIMNALRGEDITKGVSAIETFGTWGAMSAGAAGVELVYKIAAAAKAGNLLVMTANGVRRLNVGALRRAPVGRSAKMMGGLATIGALAAVQLFEHGEVDVVSLGNSIVLIQSARYITRGLSAIGPLRKATNLNPIKLLIEFLIMEGLGIAEEAAVESYYRIEKREALAAQMKEVDAAIAAMNRAKESGSADGFMAAQASYEKALAGVEGAFGDLMAFEKYTGADEYDIVHDANDEIEGLEDDLERIENMEGHPDDMPDWQKVSYMSPVSGSAGVHEMKFSNSMVKDIRRQRRSRYAALKEEAYGSVKKAEDAFNANTMALDGQVSATDLHIAFGFEEAEFIEDKAYEYQPGGPVMPMESIEISHDPNRGKTAVEMAEHDWQDRYYDSLVDDPHELMIQYMLFVKERQDYLNDLITRSSEASDED